MPIATMEVDEAKGLWEVSVYGGGEPDAELKSRVAQCLERDFPGASIEIEVFGDTDWIAKSLEGLKPVRAGRFLVHGAHDRDAVRINDLAIELEAGQAFGTGHHGTTAGCLEMIDRVMRRSPGRARRHAGGHRRGARSGHRIGGVLAIAAAKLGPVKVLATDIDPVATRVARENVRGKSCGRPRLLRHRHGVSLDRVFARGSLRADHRQHPGPPAECAWRPTSGAISHLAAR